MKAFPRAILRLPSTFIHIGAVSASFLAGALVYQPKALSSLMEAGQPYSSLSNIQSFNTVICFAIILVTLTVSRMTLWLLRKRFPAKLWRYFWWCLGELLVCCAFTGLYLVLMDHGDLGGYFSYLGRSIKAIGSVLVITYLLLGLLYMALDEPEILPADSSARLKFYDNRHQLKFITEASSVLYIESNENYIVIHYLDNGVEKRYQLRNSMKNIEPLCERAGFARAHRCYIINPMHVKQIRKGANGLTFADMGNGDEDGIPVSKKYYSSIAMML